MKYEIFQCSTYFNVWSNENLSAANAHMYIYILKGKKTTCRLEQEVDE